MVSIIIPSYNRATLIGFTLDSILAQTYPDWECIIVDDGSTDNTEDVVKKYIEADHRFSFYSRPSHMPKGANSCRNLGLSHANGEYIKWFDSDDLLTSNCLKVQTRHLDSTPVAMVCFSYAQYFDHNTGELKEPWSRNMTSDNYLHDHVINKIRWPIGAILWRKSFLPDEPFNPILKNSQEWLMHSIALSRLNQTQCVNLPEILNLIRRGNLRMSSDTSARYYHNQAKARFLLLTSLIKDRKLKVKVYYNLIKQMAIYSFYSTRKAITK